MALGDVAAEHRDPSVGGRHLGALEAILEKTVGDIGRFIENDPKRVFGSIVVAQAGAQGLAIQRDPARGALFSELLDDLKPYERFKPAGDVELQILGANLTRLRELLRWGIRLLDTHTTMAQYTEVRSRYV